MNTETIRGNWNITKGKLKQKYVQLTDNDLRYVDGQEDELLGRLQKKTGQSREALEKILNGDDANFSAEEIKRNKKNSKSLGSE